MATIKKRGNSYTFTVSAGLDNEGRQKRHYKTWKPPTGMNAKEVDKQVKIAAAQFEDAIIKGIAPIDGKIKLCEYAEIWFDGLPLDLAHETREQYRHLLTRIIAVLGHIRLDNLQPRHIKDFYKHLAEAGIKGNTRYVAAPKLDDTIKEKQLSRDGLAKLAGVAPASITVARSGKRIAENTAEKIAAALGVPVNELFVAQESTQGLSDKTIKHHHSVLSVMLNTAKRERIITNSPLEFMDAPKVKKREPRYLDDVAARQLVFLLMKEPDIRKKTALLLALYSGVRRGELCGLSWTDIDEKRGVIHVLRASQYQRGKGVVEVDTKNESSKRAIKLPCIMFDVLAEYREWWLEQQYMYGSKWQGHLERIFIRDNGLPLSPDTINYWLEKFIARHELEQITPHSLRHTFCSLQIAAGVDLKSLQQRTGHSLPSTLLNTYTHAIKSANEAAADALDNILTPTIRKEPAMLRLASG